MCTLVFMNVYFMKLCCVLYMRVEKSLAKAVYFKKPCLLNVYFSFIKYTKLCILRIIWEKFMCTLIYLVDVYAKFRGLCTLLQAPEIWDGR